jgi:hypothetical protein
VSSAGLVALNVGCAEVSLRRILILLQQDEDVAPAYLAFGKMVFAAILVPL